MIRTCQQRLLSSFEHSGFLRHLSFVLRRVYDNAEGGEQLDVLRGFVISVS